MDSKRWWCLLSKNYSILNLGEFFHSEKYRFFLHNMLLRHIASLGHNGLRDWSGEGGRELRQQHPRALLSGVDRPWSLPIITRLKNVVSNIFTTKYVQINNQVERRRLLDSIVTSRVPP